jgi:hypothetical protein
MLTFRFDAVMSRHKQRESIMGCDIHLTLEKRVGEKWICIDTFASHHSAYAKPDAIMDGYSSPTTRDRNYRRFAALAGVRGDGPTPRGVPEDASETTRYLVDQWSGDGHSHSWEYLRDATRVFLDTQWGPEGREISESIVKYPESYFFNVDCSQGSGENADDYRVIFWFDN